MLNTKFQASEPSGSEEEEDFLIYFYTFLWFEPRSPWPRAILAMLHTKVQASESNCSEEEDF